MKKKWIIALSVIGLVVITIVILSFTLFTVQQISIDYRTSLQHEYNDEQIISDSKLPKGKNIIFLKKQPYIDNIEKAYPYLEVINIETSFPSKLTIHVRERQPFYAVKSENGYFLVDPTMKVLEEVETFDSTQTNPILLPFTIGGTVGEKLDLAYLGDFYDAILLNSKTREDGLANFKQIEYFESENEVYHNSETGLKITLHSGRVVYLHNAAYGLTYKLNKFYAVENSLYKLADKLTTDQIQNSEIHINNYLGSTYDESDSYFYLVYNGERITL